MWCKEKNKLLYLQQFHTCGKGTLQPSLCLGSFEKSYVCKTEITLQLFLWKGALFKIKMRTPSIHLPPLKCKNKFMTRDDIVSTMLSPSYLTVISLYAVQCEGPDG